MLRSRMVTALAVAFGAVTLTVTAGSSAASAANLPLPIPTNGALFGAGGDQGGVQTPSIFSALEAAVGRKLDVNRVYSDLSEAQPVAQAVWDVANGIIPLISIDATDAGTSVPFAEIASGAYDSTITAEAKGLASLHVPVLLSFDHEPVGPNNGTAADFVAAWRHFFSIVKTYATNVSSVLILTGSNYLRSDITDQWYPGDQYVDWVGADGYNYDGCSSTNSSWRDFSTIFGGLEAFAVAHNKPAVVAEWASSEDPASPGRKAAWIAQAGQTMESWPQIKAASYFDATGPFPRCTLPLTSSSSAMTAFKNLGAQSFFNPRPTAVLSPASSVGQSPLGVTFSTAGSTGTLNPIASWSLDFGDGTSTSGSGTPPAQVSHTYGVGDFTATLSLTDSAGQTNLTTAMVQTTPPTVVSQAASAASTTTVNLNGSVNPNGLSADCHFAWGTTPALDQSSPQFELGAGTSDVHVTYGLTGLTPGTTYYWTLRSTSVAGSTAGPLMTLTTRGRAPALSHVGATLDAPTGVTLTGDVTPHLVDTKWYFEYGPTTSYGSRSPAPPGDAGAGASPVAVSTKLSGLAVATTYHYALVAVNAAGTTMTGDHRIHTSNPPAVGSLSATRTSTTAQLSASVNPEGLATTYHFRWGTSATLGNATSSQSAGAGTGGVRESASLSGIKPATTYYWDVVATNAAGSTISTKKTFTTPAH